MKTILTYYHTRDVFKGNEFQPFIPKYFKDVKYLGTEYGNFSPQIQVSNWEDVKDILPKYAIPIKVELSTDISMLEALSGGQLGLARHIGTFFQKHSAVGEARKWS